MATLLIHLTMYSVWTVVCTSVSTIQCQNITCRRLLMLWCVHILLNLLKFWQRGERDGCLLDCTELSQLLRMLLPCRSSWRHALCTDSGPVTSFRFQRFGRSMMTVALQDTSVTRLLLTYAILWVIGDMATQGRLSLMTLVVLPLLCGHRLVTHWWRFVQQFLF